MGVEIVDVVQHPEHVARVVENHHAGTPDHRTGSGERAGVEHEIHQVDLHRLLGAVRPFALHRKFLAGPQDLGRAATGNDRLEFSAGFQTAANLIDQLADRDLPATQFIVAGTLHVPAHAQGARAAIAGRAKFGERLTAHGKDMLHMTKRLDVVDDGRAIVETEDRRKKGRLDPRVRTLAFQRLEQARFLAANVSSGTLMDEDIAVKTRPADVPADEAGGFGFGNGFFHDPGGFGKFAADVNVSKVHIECPSGDHHAFEKLMRILVQDITVFECAGF